LKAGFTLLEVLVAVFIVGISFGAFLTLASRSVEVSDEILKTTLSTVAADNAISEVIYGGRSYTGRKVNILGYEITVNQDFEELFGFRIVKVNAGTADRGELVEIYEAR